MLYLLVPSYNPFLAERRNSPEKCCGIRHRLTAPYGRKYDLTLQRFQTLLNTSDQVSHFEGDTEYVVSSQVPHSPALLEPPIEPGALLSFDSSFFPYFAGTTELRAVFLGKENPESFDLGFTTGEEEEDRRYEQLVFTYGLLPRDEKRFESERFLAITEVDVGAVIPTAEEFIIRTELRR